jgi:hypothetical protein
MGANPPVASEGNGFSEKWGESVEVGMNFARAQL